ncbi:MAG: DUF5723 family protein [Bacteroidales bacterium]|nr:DUF5723 family protein [Bacteroidales bacterium]MCF8456004.1 DUF5723 family protein [Bacteroidales bacterium]
MKNKLRLLILSLFFLPIALQAQVFDGANYRGLLSLKPGQSELFVNGYFYTSSNSLNINFLNALYDGDFIDEDLKKSVKLNGDNYFGAETGYNLQYRFRCDSLLKIANSTLSFSLSNNYFSDMAFNDDYFTLLFYGNSAIAQADLSGFDFSYLNYQKFTLGFSKTFETNKLNITTGIGLSALKGQKFYSMEINEGHFNTIGQGISVDAAMDYEFHSSDTANFDFNDFNGSGFATNFLLAFEGKKSGNVLYAELLDLGSIKWNDQSLEVAADTSFAFDGQDIDNLLDYSFTSFSELNEDSLREDFYYSKTKKSETTTRLPAKLGLYYMFHVNQINTQILMGGQTFLNSNMPTPYFFVRVKPRFKGEFSPIVQFAYGGYTGPQIGLGLEKTFFKRLKLHIFSSHLPGFINPENNYSQHVRVSLAYRFGEV